MRELPNGAERGEHTRTDPEYAPSVEIFDNLTHRQIHAGVQMLDPAALTAGQQAWQGSATGVAEAVSQAHNEIRALIADGWRGGAAQTAAEAVRSFEQHGQRLADVMSAVARRLGQAGDAAETLRAAVGTPSDSAPDLSAALLDPSQATANSAAQKSTEHDRRDVVRAMDTIYANAFIRSGTGVPAFPDMTPADTPQGSATAPAATTGTPTAPVSDLIIPAAQSISAAPSTVPPVAAAPDDAATRQEPVAAAPATVPASTLASAPPLASTASTVDLPASPTHAKTLAAGAAQTPAAVVPDRVVTSGSGVPVVPAAAAPVVAPTLPGNGSQNSAGDERKREERHRDTNGDTVNGMGAGAIGGLMGGALAATDTTRPGSGIAAPQANRPARTDDEDDDDLEWIDDDDLTFLEPGDEPGELIGALEPTTPPVVGEWTELE
ncbi:WXG100 family type VII secretion target [Nocardia sp. NPDC005366]|uniref:WXG100 family type VII secretion target n=1 Tax=Nocardia sp. NPDC005366 TaxID=3156878 RepID=UPI0033BBB42C